MMEVEDVCLGHIMIPNKESFNKCEWFLTFISLAHLLDAFMNWADVFKIHTPPEDVLRAFDREVLVSSGLASWMHPHKISILSAVDPNCCTEGV